MTLPHKGDRIAAGGICFCEGNGAGEYFFHISQAVRDFLETPGNLWYAMYNCTNAVSAECFLFY